MPEGGDEAGATIPTGTAFAGVVFSGLHSNI